MKDVAIEVEGGYDTNPVPIDNDPYESIPSFIQIFGAGNVTEISDDEFVAASFKELCPSGDCVEDCKDLGRLFQALPDGISANTSSYGRPDSDQRMTLFGVCSNMARALEVIPMGNFSDKVQSYFPLSALSTNNASMIVSNIASCYSSTCDMTREPSKCEDACALDNFLASPSQLNFNFENNNTGSLACISRLCDNTCGLPYADQDVLGIGVLTSYYIQALLLIVCAAIFLISTVWQTWKWPRKGPTVHAKLKRPLETLLTVQTYFGVSVAVASFVMNPAIIDPLNGYALICATVMGFVPPVFTLTLMHSHGMRSWFFTGLVFASYLINTITFFILYHNLSTIKFDDEAMAAALQNLFSSTTCGGSSAMTLCHQLTGVEPLSYLNFFFNKDPFPNIKTTPVVWAWTTLVLMVLSVWQLYLSCTKRIGCNTHHKTPTSGDFGTHTNKASWPERLVHTPWSRIGLLFTASLLFCLCLGYQFLVVREYQNMDVIDKNGWSFGQIVAVLLWLPPAIDAINSILPGDYHSVAQTEDINFSKSRSSNGGDTIEKRRPVHRASPLPSQDESWPLAHSETPDLPVRAEFVDHGSGY